MFVIYTLGAYGLVGLVLSIALAIIVTIVTMYDNEDNDVFWGFFTFVFISSALCLSLFGVVAFYNLIFNPELHAELIFRVWM